MHKLVIMLLICIIFTGCKGKDNMKVYTEQEIQHLYYQAMRQFDKKNYSVALTDFENFGKDHTMHHLARNALQMEILLNFLLKKDEALEPLCDMYEKFYALDSAGIEYCKYIAILSKSNIAQKKKVPLSESEALQKKIESFAQKYHNTKYKNSIQNNYKKANVKICEGLVTVGDFYFNTNKFVSALQKYQEANIACKTGNEVKTKNIAEKKLEKTKNILFSAKF